MLVDREDDKKTHRPVVPKEVGSGSNVLATSQMSDPLKKIPTKTVFLCFDLGPQKACALPQQPGGDHQRRALPPCEEGGFRGDEEDLCQHQACS